MLIDEKTADRARNADMIAFLERRHGFTFAHGGGAYRCREHPSLAVKDDRRSWYWHSKGIGGCGAVDYLMKTESMAFREAVETAAGTAPPPSPPPRRETTPPKTLILPEKRGIPLRLYDYLCVKRGIDGGIVNTLIQKEMLYEDRRGNVVFVGHDENGKARFASLRGTYGDCSFRGDCAGSDKRYGFNMAFSPTDQLYIYESPIDAMSHASMDNAFRGDGDAWTRCNRLSLAGTSDAALPFFLNRHKTVKELVFCLDNDRTGQEASRALSRKYAEKGFCVRIEPPYRKDFNVDLQAFREQTQAERRANKRHRDASI
jgi:hypothetical protein